PVPRHAIHFPYTTLFRSYSCCERRVRLIGSEFHGVRRTRNHSDVAEQGIFRVARTRRRADEIEDRAALFHPAAQRVDLSARNLRSEEHTSELQSPDHLVC